MESILVNLQMSLSDLDINQRLNRSVHGFWFSRKLVFCNSSSTKLLNPSGICNVRTPICAVVNQSIDGAFLEKDFKFEPAFEEYLEAMEMARTGREKKLNRDESGRRHVKKKNGRPGGNADAGRIEADWYNGNVDSVKSVKHGNFEKNSDCNANSAGISRVRTRGNAGYKGDSNGGQGGNDDAGRFESDGYNVNVDSVKSVEHGNSEKNRDWNANSAGISRVWTRGNVGYKGGRDFRSLKAVNRGSGNVDLERRDLGYNGNSGFHDDFGKRREERMDYADIEKKTMHQNGRWVRNQFSILEKKMGGSGNVDLERRDLGYNGNSGFHNDFGKRRGEERMDYTDIEKKTMHQNGRWVRNQFSIIEKKMGGSEINETLLEMDRRKDGIGRERFLGNHQSRICEKENDQLERAVTHGRGIGNRLRDDAAESDEPSLGNVKLQTRLQRNDFQIERGVTGRHLVRKQESTKPTRVLRTEFEGDNLEMERKAFKSFEVFTDVRNRPRVLRMEMEERIRNLAKWLDGTSVNLCEGQFSKIMHSAKIKFTDHSILRVVQILGELGNWRRALQVVQWLQSFERFKSYKSKYIYTTVLNVLGKARRPVEALNVFRAMRQEFSSYPDMAAYHCIAVTLGQAGYMKELFDIIDCMRSIPEIPNKRTFEKWDPRLEPDAVVYNAVLNACVRRKQWEGAFWVLQQFKQQGIRPSSTTYGLVMEVMLACGKYNLVHEFFRKVDKSSIHNTLTYKVLVNALWREGRTDEAVLAVQDMERRGVVGSASLYYDLARCLCSAGRCQEALMQVDKLCKVANKPLLVTYTGLIKACLDSGNVQDGAYIFNHMHKFCSPNLVTCNTMLVSYVQNKMFKEAMDLFKKFLDGSGIRGRRKRILPDNLTFNTMLEACAMEQRWDDFDDVYRRMLHHGYVFDAKHHLLAILAASKAGKGQLLYTTWDHLVRSNRVIPSAIIKEMFSRKLEEDDIPAAISCISYRPNVPPAFSKEAWMELFRRNANRFQKESLVTLLHKVSTLVDESDKPNPVFVNLVNSCREFVNTNVLSDRVEVQ